MSIFLSIIILSLLAVIFWLLQKLEKAKRAQTHASGGNKIRGGEDSGERGALARKASNLGKLTDVVPPRSEASDALFATLSHELKTPLNGLLGIVQMLQEESENDDYDAIEGCALHMLAVISTLVNLTKIQQEWDDLPEYREWISVYELAEQVKKNLSFRAGLRGLKLEMDHQDRVTRLRGDQDHVKTILEASILGSLESVSLLEIPQSKLSMRVAWTTSDSEEGKDVEIVVTNPLETHHEDRMVRIQEAFRFKSGENHSRIPMQFLYWAVSGALLEKYNGTQTAVPLDDGGVESRVSFQMEQMKASPTDKRPIGGLSYEPEGPKKKSPQQLPVTLSILVAEDDPISRGLMATVLKLMGQEADFATNGKEVIEKVSAKNHYDLILMDIDMPIMDGISASLALRNGEAGEVGVKIPIIAVTAFNTLSDEGKFKRAGMNYFLPKPVKLKNLRSTLLEVIKKDDNLA